MNELFTTRPQNSKYKKNQDLLNRIEKTVNQHNGLSSYALCRMVDCERTTAHRYAVHLASKKRLKKVIEYSNGSPSNVFYPASHETPIEYPNEKVKRFVQRAVANLTKGAA